MLLPTSDRALFLVTNLDLEEATGIQGAVWEAFQIAHLNDTSLFRAEVKSRQIAWSWLTAAEAVANAILHQQDSIFVSINLEEAKEKLRYARSVLDNLASPVRPQLVRDNAFNIELQNGARLTSLPARPPRGRARCVVYLDEFAHVRYDRQIYTAALPVISKGGYLRMGSSPMGSSGVFWEVYRQKLRAYPGYTRRRTPWWHVFSFCTDVPRALKEADALTTEQRMERFGNSRIRQIYENMPIEDFQAEYETAFIDESTAWITWDEIRACQDPYLDYRAAVCNGKVIDDALVAIGSVVKMMIAGKCERALYVGVDIGRTRNATEITVVGESTTNTFPVRLVITLQSCPYDQQADVLAAVCQQLPIVTMLIDQTGIGNNLAEALSIAFPSKVQGVTFTNADKKLWATDAKMLVQQRKTVLPQDRDLAYQIHSIKRLVSAGKSLVFDTDSNEKHHADKFWAWALALAAANQRIAAPRAGTWGRR